MRSLWNIALSTVGRLFKSVSKVDKDFQKMCDEEEHKAALELVAERGGDSGKYWGIKVPKFEIVKRLGAGSFGTVFKIIFDNGHVAALKVSVINDKTIASFEAEMDAYARLMGHGGIPDVFWTAEANGFFLVAMEYMEGGDAFHVTWNVEFERPLIALDQLLVVVGWAWMHSVVHHDIKPDNVFMDSEGLRFVLGDWGYSGSAEDCCCDGMHKGWGTPGYTCPEVLLGRGHSSKADVWSLGVLLKFLIDGMDLIDQYGSRADRVALLGVDRSEWFAHPIWRTEFGREVRALIVEMCATREQDRLSIAQAHMRVTALLERVPRVTLADLTANALHSYNLCRHSQSNVPAAPVTPVEPVVPVIALATVTTVDPVTAADSIATVAPVAQASPINCPSTGAPSHPQVPAHMTTAPLPSTAPSPTLLFAPGTGVSISPLSSTASYGCSSAPASVTPTAPSPSLAPTTPSPTPAALTASHSNPILPQDTEALSRPADLGKTSKANKLSRRIKAIRTLLRRKHGG